MPMPDTLREFLTSRRSALEPSDVGLPPSPVPRRGRGLRREEVAVLAGVSVDYYARLEQGRVGQVSDQVIHAIEEALQLDDVERDHLRALVDRRPPSSRTARPERIRPRAGLVALIEAMDPTPAILQGPRLEVLAWNRAAAALLTDFGAMPPADRNIARWMFLDPEARTRYPQWQEVAAGVAATLRAARDPRVADPALERLVGGLSVASEEFARFWADYRLYRHGHGEKEIYHASVGVIAVSFETLAIDRSGGQFVSAYTVAVGSPSEERLKLLLSWDATVTARGSA